MEQIAPDACVDADGEPAPFAQSANAAYFASVMREFGLESRNTLVCGEGPETVGMSVADLEGVAGEADLVVNVSTHLTLEALLEKPRLKVFVDLDPGFTQFWYAGDDGLAPYLSGYDRYFTVGENVGSSGCRIPTAGLEWRPVRQPVLLDEWPVTASDDPERFTTVGSWRGPYGPIEHEGTTYGLKVHEFRKVIELPGRAPGTFELALDIHPADRKDLDALRTHGWKVVDPRRAAPGPTGFRDYVQRSGAEFSVAQGIYAGTESGWFSDRTVRYLASGKPALVQETGFSRNYSFGLGVVPFRTLPDAAEGARRILADYEEHSAAARAIAERHFDSDKVLERFLAETGVAP